MIEIQEKVKYFEERQNIEHPENRSPKENAKQGSRTSINSREPSWNTTHLTHSELYTLKETPCIWQYQPKMTNVRKILVQLMTFKEKVLWSSRKHHVIYKRKKWITIIIIMTFHPSVDGSQPHVCQTSIQQRPNTISPRYTMVRGMEVPYIWHNFSNIHNSKKLTFLFFFLL